MYQPYAWLIYGLAGVGVLAIGALLRGLVASVLARGRPRPFVSVVLLIRNQADVIEGLLRRLLTPQWFGGQPAFDYEVLAIEDGSSDDTPLILERLGEAYPALRVVYGEPDGTTAACRSPVALVLDLRDAAALPEVQAAINSLFGATPAAAAPLRTVAGDGAG